MKSYTSLEQSKKLAEILPIESTDGFYEAQINPFTNKWEDILFVGNEWAGDEVVIPAWSLAALLEILPTYLFEFDRGIDLNVYPNLNGRGWHCSYMPNCIENMKTDKFKLITSEDTLIDTCYEMILKLNELKLL